MVENGYGANGNMVTTIEELVIDDVLHIVGFLILPDEGRGGNREAHLPRFLSQREVVHGDSELPERASRPHPDEEDQVDQEHGYLDS